MKIGFTGSRSGMSIRQVCRLRMLLVNNCGEFHHGDCVGADSEAHRIAKYYGFRIVVHPPLNETKRAFCFADVLLPPEEYLVRNQNIVDATELLIAMPSTQDEIVRSGTWATVRYAWRQLSQRPGSRVRIIRPDGTDYNVGR